MSTAVIEKTRQGIFHMSNEEYHRSDPLSKSNLSDLLRSPAHYKAALVAPREETAAMAFGTAFHCAVLEPNRFGREYGVPPNVDRRTKAGKAAFAEWELHGWKAISEEDCSRLDGMKESLFAHKTLAPLFEQGDAELSFFTEIDYYGSPICLKCRPDWIDPDRGVIVDLKTTMDASTAGFARSCARYHYDLQAYLYSMICSEILGKAITAFVFAAVETKPPYGVAGYVLDPESMELGRSKYTRAIERYLECSNSGEWPSYGDRIEQLSLPKWAFYEE